MKTIIRSPEGTGRQEVEVSKIVIPDLWHVAELVRDQGMVIEADNIIDCWNLAHDLKSNIIADEEGRKL